MQENSIEDRPNDTKLYSINSVLSIPKVESIHQEEEEMIFKRGHREDQQKKS